MVFDGLFDHGFDALYHTFIPRQDESRDTKKYNRELPPPHAPMVPARTSSRACRTSPEVRHQQHHNYYPFTYPVGYTRAHLPRYHLPSSPNRSYSSQNPGRDPYNRPASAGRVDRYRPQSYGGNYDDGYDSYDEYSNERRSSRRDRKSSKSKSRRSRSRSRSGIRGQLDKRFDKSEQGLTAGALGALAGGLVGHEVGKGPLATVAGVFLGGLGANAIEARHERGKEKDKMAYGSKRSKSTDGRGRGYDDYGRDNYRDSRGGGRNRGGYDDYDSYEEDEVSLQRPKGRGNRRERAKDDEKQEMEKHFGWGNTLSS